MRCPRIDTVVHLCGFVILTTLRLDSPPTRGVFHSSDNIEQCCQNVEIFSEGYTFGIPVDRGKGARCSTKSSAEWLHGKSTRSAEFYSRVGCPIVYTTCPLTRIGHDHAATFDCHGRILKGTGSKQAFSDKSRHRNAHVRIRYGLTLPAFHWS